ncbi:MAG: hypothetical protein KJ737_00690 [Proteobacteria bacterium]|nr:hypothetical protein [Pseudomonadota bacterium]
MDEILYQFEHKDSEQISRFLFDKRDYELIRIVNDVCASGRDLDYVRRQYYSFFHPHGIKEMAESRSLRIAYAMAHLLTSFEVGGMDDRLSAIRFLREEVLETAEGSLPRNTARVLMQIMKEVVRARGILRRQLKLAHDFRITAAGKPRIIRKQLQRYHLLEMPEEWNQISFDDHVHDANTKGRKSSTHLIMDAWIKGIRRLRIVHYNFIEPRFAAELLEAAGIMDIDIRIGIEYYVRYRKKYINLIWVPRGFADAQAFLCFLEEPAVTELMAQGRQVSVYQQKHVMALFRVFNKNHLDHLRTTYGIDLEPLDEGEFIRFVGIGQKSILHLETFLHKKIMTVLTRQAESFQSAYETSDAEEKDRIEKWFQEMNLLEIEKIAADYFSRDSNPGVADPAIPKDEPDVPYLLNLSAADLLTRLSKLQSGHRITLNLSNVEVDDVLELIYDCNGMISRLELFNLKDWTAGKTAHIPAISKLQEAINEQNPIALKRLILDIIQKVEEKNPPDRVEKIEKLHTILHDIVSLQIMYKGKFLKARIGSDSTGRTQGSHGMGLAVVDTLGRRAVNQVKKQAGFSFQKLPIYISVCKRFTLLPRENIAKSFQAFQRLAESLGNPLIGHTLKVDWALKEDVARMTEAGNVIALGGIKKRVSNDLHLHHRQRPQKYKKVPWAYFDSHLRNVVKVIAGFVPAFLTFALTKDWWLLSYFGAFIWFGITGFRNILQSILGGGGFRRSPLLRWNAYVSWDRIADSLLYTGFSVPLLEFFVKMTLLEKTLGITTTTHPILLYAIMALVNGIYLSGHNAFRGLPKGAIFGNFFRSILSIPIAVLLSSTIGGFLTMAAVPDVNLVLQKWAAIISKTASDIMAGVIEGTADRYKNIYTRFRDYRKKLSDLIDVYSQLELLFPEKRKLELFEQPQKIQKKTNLEVQDLEKIICIHALDFLYFWMYQPRARSALRRLLQDITEEERHIFLSSQFTLQRQKEISQMFIDGVLGPDFARALSFYLSHSEHYLREIKRFF